MKIEKSYFWPAWFYYDQKLIKIPASPDLLKTLGQANFDLWQALNIYDDFLDQEGKPELLPVGNKHYRHFLSAYYNLHLPKKFYTALERILNQLDRANRREVKHYRINIKTGKINCSEKLPRWERIENLADKSLALALGPLALAYSSRCRPGQIKAIEKFFRLALSAKQLADDACDWKDDLAKGRITAANTLIIRAAQKRSWPIIGQENSSRINLLFAAEASLKISNRISDLCEQARLVAKEAGLKANGNIIKNIISPLERAVAETEEFRKLLTKSGIKML